VEISGLATSRQSDGVLWAHNDSGGEARVFAIGPTGADVGAFNLVGAKAVDWEDMAIGPGPETSPDTPIDYLYLADIGDNEAQRAEISVYRIQEPELDAGIGFGGGDVTGVEELRLRYPDRAHDAETLLIDPVSGDLYIVTKELQTPASFVFRAPGDIGPEAPTTLEEVGRIDFAALGSTFEPPADAPALPRAVPNLPTGGDVSADGSAVAIRTYGTVWVWPRPDGAQLWEAFADEPCEAPSAIEAQGEAIAFDADGGGYTTISEGANPPINRFSVP
jgi:hypothetical protein